MKYAVMWVEIVSAKNMDHAREKAAANLERMPVDELAGEASVSVAPFQNGTVSQRRRNRAAREKVGRTG